MTEIIQSFAFGSLATDAGAMCARGRRPSALGEQVYVLFTSFEETLRAVRVARRFAEALRSRVTVVHLRPVAFGAPLEAPAGCSPVETDEFAERLQAQDSDARVKVCLCRDARQVVRMALPDASLVVIGRRRRRWWPTRADRWRRTLEAAGFLVVVADEADDA
jgi:K+-sensing histidine kinase KdpD